MLLGVCSLRERATARTRSGDVSPEPPPPLKLQNAVGPPGWGAGLAPLRGANPLIMYVLIVIPS